VVNSHLVCDHTIRQLGFDLPLSATVVPIELFSHRTGTLRCLQKEMATYRHWSVSLWRDPDDVQHCWILSPDKTERRLISATLCGWRRCFVADQLWSMTRMKVNKCSTDQIQTNATQLDLSRATETKHLNFTHWWCHRRVTYLRNNNDNKHKSTKNVAMWRGIWCFLQWGGAEFEVTPLSKEADWLITVHDAHDRSKEAPR